MTALEELSQAVVKGTQVANRLVRKALEEGAGPVEILSECVAPAMEVVREKMETGEYFIPEVLLSARVAEQAADVVKLLLTPGSEAEPAAKVIIGTVEGDFHSFDKDLTKTMLEAAGFDVIDLGEDVPARLFVSAVQEKRADVVVIFARLATAVPIVRDTIERIKQVVPHDHVKVLIGGTALTQRYADRIGADGHGPNAAVAVRLVQKWLGE